MPSGPHPIVVSKPIENISLAESETAITSFHAPSSVTKRLGRIATRPTAPINRNTQPLHGPLSRHDVPATDLQNFQIREGTEYLDGQRRQSVLVEVPVRSSGGRERPKRAKRKTGVIPIVAAVPRRMGRWYERLDRPKLTKWRTDQPWNSLHPIGLQTYC